MRTTTIAFSILAITLRLVAAEFGDVSDCALPCIADVSGTNCTPSNWPCLCADGPYVDNVNACVMKSCNSTERGPSFLAFAQICRIFNIPLTASAEASFPASALSANANSSLSALGGPGPVSVTSLPTVSSGSTTMETSATPKPGPASTTRTAGGTPSIGTASATATGSAGNVGAGTREAWFGLAVLVLAGAAIL